MTRRQCVHEWNVVRAKRNDNHNNNGNNNNNNKTEDDTMQHTERDKLKLPFPWECIFQYNVWKQKEGQSNSQKIEIKRSICPLYWAHYLDPRGKRRCSSTKALALDKQS